MCVPGIPALGGSKLGGPPCLGLGYVLREREKAHGYHTADYGRGALTEVPGARPLCPATLTASMQQPKVRRLTGSCPTQLTQAVSLNTSNKGPCGRTGKGAMTANRGCNTFHCPLVPSGGKMAGRNSPSDNGQAHSSGVQRNPNLTLALSSRVLGEPPPACLPTLPASGMGTNTTKPFSQPKPLSREQEQREGQKDATCHQELRETQMGTEQARTERQLGVAAPIPTLGSSTGSTQSSSPVGPTKLQADQNDPVSKIIKLKIR